MDLDLFARVVDRVGGQASEGLLEAVHDRLQCRRGQHDLIVRDRGDGFIGLLAGQSREEVMTRASNLQASVGAAPYEVAGASIVLTTSAGLVFADRYDATHTYRRAEMAMVMAKTAGRNDLVFFDALEQANFDGLTGVHNRRYFDERFKREIDLAERSEGRLSLALFDLDDFGRLNKRHGHPVGDAALIEFATAARDLVGDRGWVARYGGEEFCVVARLAPDELAQLAEGVRAKVAQLPIQTPDGEVTTLTVSVGVAGWQGDAGSEVVQRASTLLKAAKGLGKNRVVCEARSAKGA
jgi:diguanylate cyclase (GGDEF)-like protein